MTGLGGWFFKSAVIYALVGMALGIHMAASQDHSQHVTHAHINLIGWVTFALFGLYYDRYREAAVGLLPKVQFWSGQVGYIVIIAGIWQIYSGNPAAEPIAAIGSIIMIISMALFAFIVFRTKAV